MVMTQPHLAKNVHLHALGSSEGSLMAEDVLPVAAGRALVVAHVLHNAQQGHLDLPEHVGPPPCIYQSNILHDEDE